MAMIICGSDNGEGMKGFQVADFLSADVPEGYQTAWGWLAKNEPNAFSFMDDPGCELIDVEDRATTVAREEGIAGFELPAPEAVVNTGGRSVVKAFPNILYRYIFAS